MGKKKNKKNNNPEGNLDMPFVSLCTPTFNRRPFIPFMIKCFEHQTYPKDRIEWIIIDDGSDPIEDLVSHIPQVKYFYFEEKMLLGKKRNLMHSKCSGDIIVYMDDDDYYPPERISHAVETLNNNPTFLFAGSSEMHIYFDSKKRFFSAVHINHFTLQQLHSLSEKNYYYRLIMMMKKRLQKKINLQRGIQFL